MDRINHVKITSPDPAAIDRFLREVVDIPEGWPLGSLEGITPPADVPSGARDENGRFTRDAVYTFRGNPELQGFIVGDGTSRGFQVLHAETAKIWGIAIGTRDLEGAYERCVERGIPCTEPAFNPWTESETVHFFYAEVGGIVFEVMRMEPRT